MNQFTVVKTFSHVNPGDTEYKGGGLRDFFLYRDLGIAGATGGQAVRTGSISINMLARAAVFYDARSPKVTLPRSTRVS